MAYVRRILIEPHPMLHKAAKKMSALELKMPLTQQLIDDMLATMHAAPGIGLAAPQIGVGKRIIVVDVGEQPEPHVVVNPVLTEFEGEETAAEGCLSIPGKIGDVTRAQRCAVGGMTRHGKRFALQAEGLLARCFQHEVDHLDGVLITDKASNVRDAVVVPSDSQEEKDAKQVPI
ncbi:MAG: peptide deformylase [Candidatus Eremiobacter antarcticus]|nr:peptide deformylase [Candidatus Eremiobacteraeota bacterium]MBC5808626.1 peptide deformylase [Candidatus Eremiobacteraeota bacterium]PZR64329.1 MAG: peptide deformylase [Candidatus Eremiobacter sp. RRmetagenome_bin22]